jgi:hypothetical protein
MKKVFKIFKIVKGYHGDRVYYDTTPQQLDDVTYAVAEKHAYKSEEAAMADLEKCEEPRLRDGEFLILPVYTK